MEPGTKDPREGTTLGGKFEIIRRIGRGGMGTVYEARNTWTKRGVAIKLLRPELSEHRDALGRFLQEAQTASQIHHPNIIDVLDLGQDIDGSLFIVQELVIGEDLSGALARRGRLEPAEAVDIALPIMGALAAAHRKGVVHRDIKPENVLLGRTEGGELLPKLIDFGVSKVLVALSSERFTKTGVPIGTPAYMSPEQCRAEAQIDGLTDVWSMGVLLYEMLAGVLPFEATNANLMMVRIMTEPPRRIEEVLPEVHPQLAAVIHTALQRDRAQRFADMSEFIRAMLGTPFAGWRALERHRLSLGNLSLGASTSLAVPDVAAPGGLDDAADAVWLRADTLISPRGSDGFETPVRAPSDTVETPKTWEVTVEADARSTRAAGESAPVRRRPPLPKMGVALVAAGLVIGFGALVRERLATQPSRHVSPSAPGVRTFSIDLRAVPPTAQLRLDNRPPMTGRLVWELPRDGRLHSVQVTAPGYVGRSIVFRDAPPESPLWLSPQAETPGRATTPSDAADDDGVQRVLPPRAPAPPGFAMPRAGLTPSAGAMLGRRRRSSVAAARMEDASAPVSAAAPAMRPAAQPRPPSEPSAPVARDTVIPATISNL